MADKNTPDLQDRLSTFSQKGKAKRRGGNIGVGALAIALALGGGGAAYFLATNLQEGTEGLETSDVETFQDQRTGNGGRLEFPPDEAEQRVNDALIAVEEALDVPAPAPAAEPSAAVLEEIAKLREALAASQSARNAEIQEAVSDLREAFQVQTDALEASIAAKDTEIANAQRQNEARLAGLQAMLDAERAQREGLEAEMARDGLTRRRAASARSGTGRPRIANRADFLALGRLCRWPTGRIRWRNKSRCCSGRSGWANPVRKRTISTSRCTAVRRSRSVPNGFPRANAFTRVRHSSRLANSNQQRLAGLCCGGCF
jgi:hypothetical protein